MLWPVRAGLFSTKGSSGCPAPILSAVMDLSFSYHLIGILSVVGGVAERGSMNDRKQIRVLSVPAGTGSPNKGSQKVQTPS